MRKQRFATGYVLVDAADIFSALAVDHLVLFTDGLEEAMALISNLVVRRAIAERRHIVTELIGPTTQRRTR